MAKKKSFLANSFNKFARKIPCNMKISNSVSKQEQKQHYKLSSKRDEHQISQ